MDGVISNSCPPSLHRTGGNRSHARATERSDGSPRMRWAGIGRMRACDRCQRRAAYSHRTYGHSISMAFHIFCLPPVTFSLFVLFSPITFDVLLPLSLPGTLQFNALVFSRLLFSLQVQHPLVRVPPLLVEARLIFGRRMGEPRGRVGRKRSRVDMKLTGRGVRRRSAGTRKWHMVCMV